MQATTSQVYGMRMHLDPPLLKAHSLGQKATHPALEDPKLEFPKLHLTTNYNMSNENEMKTFSHLRRGTSNASASSLYTVISVVRVLVSQGWQI